MVATSGVVASAVSVVATAAEMIATSAEVVATSTASASVQTSWSAHISVETNLGTLLMLFLAVVGYFALGWFVTLMVFVHREKTPDHKGVVFAHVLMWPFVLVFELFHQFSVVSLVDLAEKWIEQKREERRKKKTEDAKKILANENRLSGRD